MKLANFTSKKIKLTYVCLLAFICLPAIAQTADNIVNENSTALENNNKLPDSPCSFSGDFIQTKTITGLDKNLESNGSFYYHCQDGVIWSTHSPIDETLIFSRTGNNFQIREQEVSKLKGRQSKLLGKLLNTMMSGNQSEIMQQFSLNDRKDQLTSIESTQTNSFDITNDDSAEIRHSHCLTSGITTLACDQLYFQPE